MQWTNLKVQIKKHARVFQKNNVDIRILLLHHGKGVIKRLRISPDSFMQMALQLAFYRMHKTVPKTYETAMTR